MFTKKKFLSLSPESQHKKAAEFLRAYLELSKHLELPDLKEDFPSLSDRYHLHLKKTQHGLKEHNLLYPVQKKDGSAKQKPFLPTYIYLENLRSAYNVGQIIRTTEAFRLGTVIFSVDTPPPENEKVKKASMDTWNKVPCLKNKNLKDLPSPLIALETSPDAPDIHDFKFPETFTLLLGNEEYGIKEETLKHADYIVKIPLVGNKNSLNVAAAYAIVAAEIRRQADAKD